MGYEYVEGVPIVSRMRSEIRTSLRMGTDIYEDDKNANVDDDEHINGNDQGGEDMDDNEEGDDDIDGNEDGDRLV